MSNIGWTGHERVPRDPGSRRDATRSRSGEPSRNRVAELRENPDADPGRTRTPAAADPDAENAEKRGKGGKQTEKGGKTRKTGGKTRCRASARGGGGLVPVPIKVFD